MNAIFMGVIVPLSILLPLFLGFYRFSVLERPGRILLWYLVVAAAVSLAARIIASELHLNNMPLLHIFTVIEFYLLLLFYRELLFTGKVPLFFNLLPLLFLVACCLNAYYLQSIYTYNSYMRSLEALTIMLLAVNYFAKIAAQPNSKVTASQYFWFNAGLFLYFSGAFMLFIFANFIMALSRQNFDIIWNIHASFVLVMYILIAIGFIKCTK